MDVDAEDAVPALAAVVAVTALVLCAGVAVSLAAPGSVLGGDPETDTDAQHAQPGSAGAEPDLDAVRRYLSTRLVSGVQIDAESLRPGLINETRAVLNGTRYEAVLNQYAEVADDTGAADHTGVYRDVHENQRAFVIAVDEYWQTYDRYQEVRRSADGGTAPGDGSSDEVAANLNDSVDDPARYLAHRLEANWSRVLRHHNALAASYRRANDVTDRDFSASIRSINATRRNVSATHEDVRERDLVGTSLSVSADGPDLAFDDPLAISGRLTGENGSGVANETVRVLTANRTVATRTDADGEFSLSYRPALLSVNATEILVEAVPGADTSYARSSSRVDVTVRQTVPVVEVDAEPAGVRYGETLHVSGRVGNDGGVAGVPYLVTVDGIVVARETTGAGGSVDATAPLPVAVPAGERTVRISTLLEGRALAPKTERTSVDVAETPSNLTASVSGEGGRTVAVEGRLTTTDGAPAVDQRVDVAVDGTRVGSTLTGADGRFETSVVAPEGVVDGGPLAPLRSNGQAVDVTVRYAQSGTNLGDATAISRATVYAELSAAHVVGAVVLALLAAGVGYWLLRRRGDDADGAPGTTTGQPGSGPGPAVVEAGGEGAPTVREDPGSLFAYAHDRLAAGRPADAVRAGYVAARRGLESRLGRRVAGTHWEFYRACRREGLDDETVAAIREATESYERAAFAPESVEAASAERDLERMARLAGVDDADARTVDAASADD